MLVGMVTQLAESADRINLMFLRAGLPESGMLRMPLCLFQVLPVVFAVMRLQCSVYQVCA